MRQKHALMKIHVYVQRQYNNPRYLEAFEASYLMPLDLLSVAYLRHRLGL